jgi:hypothetical protein
MDKSCMLGALSPRAKRQGCGTDHRPSGDEVKIACTFSSAPNLHHE